MAAVSGRSLQRALLRECRRLGPEWFPSPHSNDRLWGQGSFTRAGELNPRLLQVLPASVREGLASARRAPAHLSPWLRSSLRRPASSGSETSEGASWVSQETLLFLREQSKLTTCTSKSEEVGLQVTAVSGHVAGHPNVRSSQYVFAYNMCFTNSSNRRLRLLSRQYDFREGSGALASQIKAEQPEAAGVVGFTPILEPGASFEFGSGVVLNSPKGAVTGRFLVMVEPPLEGEDLELHRQMEDAELVLRLAYFKGLGTEQFYIPLGQLRFDADVPVISAPVAR